MDRLCVIADNSELARDVGARLCGVFEPTIFTLDRLPDAPPAEYTFVDVDLRKGACSDLRNWLKRRPRDARVIFCVRRDSHAEAVQAHAIGATGLIARPYTAESLRAKFDEGHSLASVTDGFETEGLAGIGAGVHALHEIFEAVLAGGPIDPKSINKAGDAVVSTIDEQGLSRWVEVVRKHHSQTYQHCLLVTGVAVGFARRLGFSRADKQRLAAAGLLHDIGKAKIPIDILEKQGPLDRAEMVLMQEHPMLGFEVLQTSPGIQPEMVDMVVHHHEYLDGSGYPHALQAQSISDLVRTITISDIYGALIERRSYKPPLAPREAYEILLKMDGKLDRDLVREFRTIAHA
jgi:putative nucleotidyltransferase with HDIG domain